jgi:Uma2 family endonuclease
VPLYWIVDPDARTAEAWTPADRFPRLEREALEWSPGAAEPFRLRLEKLFRPL